jgi:transcriptional regulator with XRE-family HTH domain
MMMTRPTPRTLGETRLDRFLTARGINRKRFAKETGYSRQWVQRVRFGDSEPTAKAIRCFVNAARALANDASIKANDLFPLDDDDSSQ